MRVTYVMLLMFATLTVVMLVSTAIACSPPPKPLFWVDKKIKVEDDCSFSRAEGDYYYAQQGDAAVNVGQGIISQRIVYPDFCGGHSSLLVVDCKSAKAAMLEGAPHPTDPIDYGGGPVTSIEYVLRPIGKMRISNGITMDRIRSDAVQFGYRFNEDLSSVLARMKPRNRYNPFCGCSFFYPDLAGANQ